MDWIFEHLRLLVLVGGALAWWLNQRKREKQGLPTDYSGEGKYQDSRPTRPVADLPGGGLDDLSRRIQEEIRRKIAERQGQPQPRTAVPPPLQRAVRPVPPPERAYTPAPPPVAPRPPQGEDVWGGPQLSAQPMTEAAPAWQEEMARLEAQKRAAQALAASISSSSPGTLSAAASGAVAYTLPGRGRGMFSAAELRGELRDRNRARKAILMREVLGTPVGLR